MLENLEAAFNREKQSASDASHELRTPIAVIMSHAEDALSGTKKESDYKETMEIILRESQKMGRMVSQLLMLARGYEGKYKLEMEDMDLRMLIKNVAEEMRERTLRSDIEIYLNLDNNVRIKADQTLITQLLINILGNAVKFSKKNGWVKVTLQKEKNSVRILIEDNGIGMSKEDLSNIFKRFYRADRVRTGEGTVLGLSIVKWIVGLYNGNITVNSELGKGTIFDIELNILI